MLRVYQDLRAKEADPPEPPVVARCRGFTRSVLVGANRDEYVVAIAKLSPQFEEARPVQHPPKLSTGGFAQRKHARTVSASSVTIERHAPSDRD